MRWLKRFGKVALSAGLVLSFGAKAHGQKASAGMSYLGFDRNEYPGDDAMVRLRKQFAFVGYWLSPPPGEKTNSWVGKRDKLASQGFGFVLLHAGRPGSS